MSSPTIDRLNDALGDRYRVEGEIGQGGMATVYLADDLRHHRKVALKVLRPELSAAVGAERFLREIRIAAQLSHPNIVGLIDSGEADGFLYYVMFYVEGESLRERLDREKQLSIDEALRIARQVGDALGYAHERGVIHRDIKPDNILLEGRHARVADFGIAKALSEAGSEGLTRTGLAVGTPTYMSPEQAAGSAEADERSDIYSLACVVYEMLAGGPPFRGATPPAVLARKMMEKPPGLRVVRSAVPEAMESALVRALDPTPADRHPAVDAFLADLASEEAATGPQGVGPGRRAMQPGRPIGRRLVVGGLVLLALAAAGALGMLANGDGDEPSLTASFRQITTEPGVEDGACPSPDGEWVVYSAEEGGDRDIFLRSVDGQAPFLLTPDAPADDAQPAFSPDGNRIAFRSSRSGGGIFVMGRTGDGVRRVTDDGFNPAWSPDGTRLVYTMENVGITPLNMELTSDLWIVPVDGGNPVALGLPDGVDPSWSPGGHRIAYSTRRQPAEGVGARMDIMTVPADGGAPMNVTRDDANDWHPAWSADGRHLYFVSDRGGSMNLWRVAIDERSGRVSGEPRPVTAPSQFVAHPCVSADGRHIVFSNLVTTTQNAQAMSFDPATGRVGEPRWVTTGTRRWANPDPDGDGSRLVLYSQDRPEGDLYVVERLGGEEDDGWSDPRQLTSDSAIDRVPRWSPDGERIAYFSNRAGVLDVWTIRPDGSDNRQITFGGAGVAIWSPDGSRLAAAGPGWGARVGTAAGPWRGQPVDSLPRPEGPSGGQFAVNDWSPDGAWLTGTIDYRDSGILVFSLEDRTYETLTDFGQWPVFLPDSRRILFVSGGNAFFVVDMSTGVVDRIYSTPWDVLGPPRIPDDGRTLFFTRRVTEGDVWLATIE